MTDLFGSMIDESSSSDAADADADAADAAPSVA
jgi:hypothetical protein